MYDVMLYQYFAIRNRLAALGRREEGVETLEVIAIMAILVILLGALSTVFSDNAANIAQQVITGIQNWASKVASGGK